MPSDAEVDEALAAGDFRAAFTALRWTLCYPQGRKEWRGQLDRFARICEGIAGDELAAKVRAVADERAPSHVQALYDLGFDLVEQDLPEIAATFLARACEIAPGHPELLSELCAALEGAHMNAEAVRWLEGAPTAVEESFVLRYLLAWNAMMTGDLARVRQVAPSLGRPSDHNERAMQHRLAGVVTRADTVASATALDGRDLRGWHFVINGAVLLHLSPYGLDEGMNGRYAFTQDSEATCHEALLRLRHALIALDISLTTVLTLDDPDSLALGTAAARFLGVPARPFFDAHDAPGLIVAYDLALVAPTVVPDLQPHRPGQILWTHASSWTRDQPIAGDIVTYLHQMNTSPWGERLGVDPVERATRRIPRDEGPPDALADRILSATVEPAALADLDALDRLARRIETLSGDHAGGVFRSYGMRRRQWSGGPVPSNRFL
jgi:hypothetical protein